MLAFVLQPMHNVPRYGNSSIPPHQGRTRRGGRSLKVVGRETLEKFARKHADVRGQIDAWVCDAEEAEWQTPDDIKRRYASASFLANKRVIFNLKENKYRLDTKISFKNQVVLIMRIGTHAEYSTWEF